MITRQGNEAVVYSYNGAFPYIMVGAYWVNTNLGEEKFYGWIPVAWRANGRIHDTHDSGLDLLQQEAPQAA
jgi:hypothetical protein